MSPGSWQSRTPRKGCGECSQGGLTPLHPSLVQQREGVSRPPPVALAQLVVGCPLPSDGGWCLADYDALLTEAGDYTDKYFKLQELFKYILGTQLPIYWRGGPPQEAGGEEREGFPVSRSLKALVRAGATFSSNPGFPTYKPFKL